MKFNASGLDKASLDFQLKANLNLIDLCIFFQNYQNYCTKTIYLRKIFFDFPDTMPNSNSIGEKEPLPRISLAIPVMKSMRTKYKPPSAKEKS